MPQPRRRTSTNKPAEADAPANVTSDEEEDEGTEEQEQPKRAPRAAKVYKVVDAELANELAGGDDIKEGDPATGEMIHQMRENKAKWDADATESGIKFVFGSNTAIPLRNLYNKWLAEQDEDNELSLDDPDAIYEALISGQGWVTLAARCGATQQQVKEAVADIVAEKHDGADVMNGRAYGKGDNWTWVSAEALNEAKAANGNGDSDDEEEDEEEGDEEAEATEEQPAAESTPRRRRRQQPAQS